MNSDNLECSFYRVSSFKSLDEFCIDGNHNDYLNKYTGKEHQTGEFIQFGAMNRGVEMFDFDARFFEPQLARWVVPDPAM
ncbi:MAG: hypothetical protein WBG42_09515, partial [Cryomorphaceae bacterium]